MNPSLWRRIWPCNAALLSGVLLALCYPNFDVAWLAWVWMAPLLVALWYGGPEQKKRVRFGLATGFSAGAAFFLINLSWLHAVTSAGAVLLALYLALYFALWGAFAATIGRPEDARLAPPKPGADPDPSRPGKGRAIPGLPGLSADGLFASSLHALRIAFLNAAAWTGLEWLRGIVFTGFGWNGLGVALHDNLFLIQAADLVGVTGLSFLLIFCGCIGVSTIRRLALELSRQTVRPHLDFAAALLLVIGVFFYGLNRVWRSDLGETIPLRTVLIQPNIAITEKWDLSRGQDFYQLFDNLTSIYTETGDYDLIIWPETALQAGFFHPASQDYLNFILAQGDGDFHLMLGVEEYLPVGETAYNSAALLRGTTRDVALYQKVHLVAFGEYIPLRKIFPPFEWIAGRQIVADFTAGESREPLPMQDSEVEIIPAICFEDTIGRLMRKFVRDTPQLIVNVTNDAWFLQTQGSEQHLANAKFRCVELKRPMARCANTGVSGFIDPFGSMRDKHGRLRRIEDIETGSTFITGTLPGTIEIPRHPPRTIYARYGDWFAVSMLGVSVLATGLGIGMARRSPRSRS